jgi:hypothetical protein
MDQGETLARLLAKLLFLRQWFAQHGETPPEV